jgi:ubiquinone/menaquinone biosynthesis C-methylase UbiE
MTTVQPIDPSAFRAFEHAGWQSVAAQYNKEFGQLTSQTIEALLDAAQVRNGVKLLDIATGPGYVAGAAAQRGANALGVDFSSAMVAEAQRRFPNVDFREGDAEALPFPDENFDAVTMNFGLLHVGQPERAIREVHRILRPGSRFGFTVWANPNQTVGFDIVLRAVQAHGNLDVPLPPGPPFFRFSDPGECEHVLYEAGFETPIVVQLPLVWRLNSPDTVFEALYEGTVRTAGLLRAQTPDALNEIRTAITNAARAYQRGDILELPMPAILASAVKV